MLSDIPIGLVPIFRRPSSTDRAPGDARTDETRVRATGNESSAAAATAATPAPSAQTLPGGQGEPATSTPVVPPSPSPSPAPASTWEDQIAAAEKRFAAPAPEPAPPRVEAESAPVQRPAVPLHVSAAERWHWRHACNWLQLFRICHRSCCRHAGRCRGEPVACLCAGVRHAPDGARQFVIRMMKAHELGLSFEDAFDDAADYHDAYFAWLAGLQAAQRR